MSEEPPEKLESRVYARRDAASVLRQTDFAVRGMLDEPLLVKRAKRFGDARHGHPERLCDRLDRTAEVFCSRRRIVFRYISMFGESLELAFMTHSLFSDTGTAAPAGRPTGVDPV